MKKILLLVSSLFLICNLTFAKEKKQNFFEKRYFEIKTGTSFDFSNNIFSLDELMVKELVIDLRQIADSMTKDGMIVTAGLNPYMAMNLNVGKVQVGVQAGVDIYEKMSTSKELFDFLGYGNKLGETLNVTIKNYLDVFAYSDVKVGIDFEKFSVYGKPAVFVPIFSMAGNVGSASFKNDAQGNIVAKVNVDCDFYSPLTLDADNNFKSIDYIFGVDLAGGFAIPVGKLFVISGDGRIPILPAHFTKKSRMKLDMDYVTTTSTLSEGSPETSNSIESNTYAADYWLNRPFIFNAYVDFYPLGYLFDIRLGGGFGIHNPFFDDAYAYPEYYLGAKLNVFHVLKFGVSTEYTRELFKHQADFTLNLRLFQLDTGVSFQSADFRKSIQGAGVGAFTFVTIGF